MKDGLVRADTLPLVFRALGAEALPRGAHVRVRITGTDLLTLDVHASVVARLDDAAAAGATQRRRRRGRRRVEAPARLTLAIDVHDATQAADGRRRPPPTPRLTTACSRKLSHPADRAARVARPARTRC